MASHQGFAGPGVDYLPDAHRSIEIATCPADIATGAWRAFADIFARLGRRLEYRARFGTCVTPTLRNRVVSAMHDE